MNYTQTLEFLFQSLPVFETQGATAYKPGLERITAFCRHIGNPQRNFFTIHVAGTNGKGSVAHIIASVLQQAGYRTGLFTSPHLQDFRERIRVDGEMIPKQKVVNFVDKHHDKMVELELSFFEMTAAMAFDYFAQSDVEVAVIETGLGGRLDATNIIVPILSVITNIGLEHTSLLGDTLPKIAAEKAGIIKKSIPVIIGEADARYNGVIEQAAAANKSRVIYAEQEFSCEEHHMKGTGQSFRLHGTAFEHNGVKTGPAICYEGLYGDFYGGFVRRGAQFMAIISNDGWWGDTPGYKHLFSISRLRAVEHRRAIARSANTGKSGFISARGDVGQTLGWEQRGVITAEVPLNSELTFYTRYGDCLARISEYILLLSVLYYVAYRYKRRNHLVK